MPTRAELDEQAAALGLDPDEYDTKADLEAALEEAEGDVADDAAFEAAAEVASENVPDTPSAIALDKVGAPEEGESDEELNKRAEKYAAEKRKVRWG